MIGMDGRSFFRLRVTGISAEDDTSPTYGVHLHEGNVYRPMIPMIESGTSGDGQELTTTSPGLPSAP